MLKAIRRWWRERACRKGDHVWVSCKVSQISTCATCGKTRRRDITDIVREAHEAIHTDRLFLMERWAREYAAYGLPKSATIKFKRVKED